MNERIFTVFAWLMFVCLVTMGVVYDGVADVPEPVIPTHRITEVEVTVVWYDTHAEATAEYNRRYPDESIDEIWGFAVYEDFQYEGNEDWFTACEIHQVRPVIVDDQDTLTLGHEMLHCLEGEYHR